MHFEILVEDLSGKATLDILIPKIIGKKHTFRVISYRGIGHIPKDLKSHTDAHNRILLDRLPELLKGYGKTYTNNPAKHTTVLIVVCDLDDKCLKTFRQKLLDVLNKCKPEIETRFCIAVEEGEAWFLGDLAAIKKAYPKDKNNLLNRYQNDSICDTWELLADAIFAGGSSRLKKRGWQTVGREKSAWAEKITPYMDINNNKSPSFCYFRDKIRELI
jgi:hypothetical protein